MKKDYKQMASEILELVGGSENVRTHVNCITRLRITPINEELVDLEALKKLDYVIGVQVVSGITQVILGQGTVGEVEIEFRKLLGGNTTSIEEPSEEKKRFKDITLNFIQQTMMPLIPVLVGGPLLVAIINMFTLAGVEITKDATPLLYFMNVVGNMVTANLAVFVAVTATRALNSKSFIPLLFALVIYFGDIADLSFGPITLSNGIGGMLGIVLMVICLVQIEKFCRKIVPNIVASVFVPFLTVFIGLFAVIFVVAPVGNFMTLIVMAVVNFILNGNAVIYILGHAVIGALWPLFVLTGTHQVVIALVLPYLETLGYTPLLSAGRLFTATVAGAAIGSIIKYRKDNVMVETSTSSGLSAILGVTEPAIYGILLPKGRNFFLTMVSGLIGGILVGIFRIQINFGVPGIFVVTTVYDPATMFIPYTIIYLVTFALSVALIVFFGTAPDVDVKPSKK